MNQNIKVVLQLNTMFTTFLNTKGGGNGMGDRGGRREVAILRGRNQLPLRDNNKNWIEKQPLLRKR